MVPKRDLSSPLSRPLTLVDVDSLRLVRRVGRSSTQQTTTNPVQQENGCSHPRSNPATTFSMLRDATVTPHPQNRRCSHNDSRANPETAADENRRGYRLSFVSGLDRRRFCHHWHWCCCHYRRVQRLLVVQRSLLTSTAATRLSAFSRSLSFFVPGGFILFRRTFLVCSLCLFFCGV